MTDQQAAQTDTGALLKALREIAFLRPGGPTKNKLVMQMERIAIDAIDEAALRATAPATAGGREAISEAFRRGAMAALGCRPWDDADDFFALVGLDYADGKPFPPTMPKPSIPPAQPAGGEIADMLVMTGCRDREDLEDMARVGKSLLEAIQSVTTIEGPFKGWAPADDPAEIVTDLFNALTDALASPGGGSREEVADPWRPIESAPRDIDPRTMLPPEKTGLAHSTGLGTPVLIAVQSLDFPGEDLDVIKGCWALDPNSGGAGWWNLEAEEPLDRDIVSWTTLPAALRPSGPQAAEGEAK